MFWHVGHDDLSSRFVLKNDVVILFGLWNVGFWSTGHLKFAHYVLTKQNMCVKTTTHMEIYAYIPTGYDALTYGSIVLLQHYDMLTIVSLDRSPKTDAFDRQ